MGLLERLSVHARSPTIIRDNKYLARWQIQGLGRGQVAPAALRNISHVASGLPQTLRGDLQAQDL
jgi:hypothetical protein